MNFLKKNIIDVEKLFNGICDIYEYIDLKDNDTHIMKTKLQIVHKNIPCRLSYSKNSYLYVKKMSNINNLKKQNVKLFLKKDILVKAGSQIIITQNGKTTGFKNSGEPMFFSSHQEIILEISEVFM